MIRPCITTSILLLACPFVAGAAPATDPVGEARELAGSVADPDSERRLDDLVRALSDRRGDPPARALLEELALRKPQIYVRHEEGHAMIPLVDVGAAARAVLKNWERRDAFDHALQATRAAQADFVARYLAAGEVARRGIRDAVAHMTPTRLSPYRHDIADAIGQTGGDALAAEAALALADAELAALVILRGSDAVVQMLVPRLAAAFDATITLQLLRSALLRAPVASLTLFQIDSIDHKQADETIWSSLSDPELGATAAAILARRTDRETIERLVGLTKTARAPLTRQRARLALTLSADPYARSQAGRQTWEP